MKARTPSSDPLPNPRHEAFAREVALGRNATQAYINVYGTKNRNSDGLDDSSFVIRHSSFPRRRVASTGGSRLLRRKPIVARIKAIQQAGAAGVALDLREIHDFLTRVVRTPAGDIVPSSDLCTRVKHTRDGTTDVWMPNKLACLRLSAKLQGFLDKPPKCETPEPPQPDAPPILTEERRAILMARRRAAIRDYKEQAEEERLAQEKPPAKRQPADAERRTVEPAPPVWRSGDRNQDRIPQSHAGTPIELPNTSEPAAPKPAPKPGPAIAGPWIPHWRQGQTRNQKLEPSEARQPIQLTQNQLRQTSNLPRSGPRVTPDSSTQIVII
jgi:hypothetical protein